MAKASVASRTSLARAFAAGSAVLAVALVPYPDPRGIGHALTLGPGGWSAPVQYARIELFRLPARALGTLLALLAAGFVCWRQRSRRGSGPARAVPGHHLGPRRATGIMLKMSRPASRTKPLTLADVDPDDDADMDRLEHEEVASSAERVKQAIQGHRAAGLVDEKGRRISEERPPDMRPDSNSGV